MPGESRPGLLARWVRAWREVFAPGTAEASSVPRVVVGLGNPGPRYAATRHNAGFRVVDAAAERAGLRFEAPRRPYVLARGAWEGAPVALAKPAGLYMNQSGAGVAALLADLGLEPADLLLVYDDLALPEGQLRLRARGGAGGHNGVQDVIRALGTENFPRLRVGIGSNFARGRQVDYVLGPFSPEQEPVMAEAFGRAATVALAFARDGLEAALNRLSAR